MGPLWFVVRSPRAEPALPAFRDVLAKYAKAIDANWDGVFVDDDPEYLHRLRVAVRKTRATLAAGKGVIDEKDRRWARRGFRQLAALTSVARDYDVAVIDWPARIAALDPASRDALAPVHDALVALKCAAHEQLNLQLSRRRTRRFIKRWRAWLAKKPRRRGRRAGAPVGKAVDKQRRKLEAQMDRFASVDSVEARHALRKTAKRLRYIVDGFGSLFDDEERDALTDRLVSMQDDLGRGRDAAVQADIVRLIVAELPPSGEMTRAVDELLRSLGSSAAPGTPPSPADQDAPPKLTPSNT